MKRRRLADIRCFLLDMDGTLYLGAEPVDGAKEFVHYLAVSGRKYLFITNNSSADAAQYSEKLSRMGIAAHPRDVVTSGEATARYLVSQTHYRRAFVLGAPSFEDELLRAGVAVVQERPDVVVLAFDKTLNYAKLERATLLLREGLPYIATNPDKVCPTDYGYIPDCGSMAALLREAANREPQYVGKPNPEMAAMGLLKLGAAPDTAAMVGDRLYTDMQMAYDSGVASILVLTGETAREDLVRVPRQPDFVFESVRQLAGALEMADKR